MNNDNENIEISNISEEIGNPKHHYHHEDDSFNHLSMSTTASHDLHSHVNNLRSEQYPMHRPDGLRNHPGFDPGQRPMPNHYMVANQHHFNSLNGPHVVQQHLQTAAAYHTNQHLMNG